MPYLLRSPVIPLMAAVLSPLVAVAILAIAFRASPLEALYWIFYGGFSPPQLPETLVRAAPILITAAGLVPAYMARVWNIGSEGQFLLGAVGSAWIGLSLAGTGGLGIAIAIIFGGLCGAAWASIPALLRVYRGSNEVFTTLMMNYIASYLASYLLQGPLRSPISLFPETAVLARDLWLEPLFPGTRVNMAVLASLLVAPTAVYILVSRSTIGVGLRAVGEGIAGYLGLREGRYILGSMAVSGLAAGVAGSLEVLGIHHRAIPSISQGYGYLSIPVAVVASQDPRLLLPASIALGGMVNGVSLSQMVLGLPSGILYVLQGLLLLASLFLARRWSRPWTRAL